MIKKLIAKDWRLFSWIPLIYLLGGLVASFVLSINNKTAFYVGFVLILSLFATIGAHLIFASVVHEKKNQNLPFIFSLPVSFLDYSLGKLFANLTMTLFFWVAMYLMMASAIFTSPNLPNGLFVMATIITVYMYLLYMIILSVAMITESEAITIFIMGISHVSISIFLFAVSQLEGIRPFIENASPVWNSTTFTVIAGMKLLIVGLIATIYFLQGKKTSFS